MNMRSYIEESNFFKGISPEEIAKKYSNTCIYAKIVVPLHGIL